jgi:hypothetical protein
MRLPRPRKVLLPLLGFGAWALTFRSSGCIVDIRIEFGRPMI